MATIDRALYRKLPECIGCGMQQGDCMNAIRRGKTACCPDCKHWERVIPCEHGRIDPHKYRVSKTLVDGGVVRNCPGAGLDDKQGRKHDLLRYLGLEVSDG